MFPNINARVCHRLPRLKSWRLRTAKKPWHHRWSPSSWICIWISTDLIGQICLCGWILCPLNSWLHGGPLSSEFSFCLQDLHGHPKFMAINASLLWISPLTALQGSIKQSIGWEYVQWIHIMPAWRISLSTWSYGIQWIWCLVCFRFDLSIWFSLVKWIMWLIFLSFARMSFIHPSEWKILSQYSTPDIEVFIEKTEDDSGRVTFSVTPGKLTVAPEGVSRLKWCSVLPYFPQSCVQSAVNLGRKQSFRHSSHTKMPLCTFIELPKKIVSKSWIQMACLLIHPHPMGQMVVMR